MVLFKSGIGTVEKTVKSYMQGKLSAYQNSFTFTELAVSQMITIGVRQRTMLTTRGTRISTMVTRTTTIRTIQTGYGLFGVLNKPELNPNK